MAMLFNLYSCDETQYPSINGVKSNEFTTFLGKKVYIQNDPTKVYTVGRMVCAAMPEITFSNDAFDNDWTVHSIKVNNVEYLPSPQYVTLPKLTDPTTYINYLPSDTIGQNVGNFLGQNMLVDDSSPHTFPVSNCGFYLYLKNLIETTLQLPINVAKQDFEYLREIYVANLDSSTPYITENYENIIFQKRDSDSFEISFSYEDNSNLDTQHTAYNNKVFKLVFGTDQSAKVYVDGVEAPLFSPAYTFDQVTVLPYDGFSLDGDLLSPVSVDDCIIYSSSFNTDVAITGANDCCTSFSFSDTSSIYNTFPGHSVFGYRLIRLIKADGTIYEWSSAVSDDPDATCEVLSPTNVNDFTYNFIDSDIDGIYEVQIYNFPEWDSTVTYNQLLTPIVHKGDKLYKCVQSSINVDPSTEVTPTYWQEYDLDETTLLTRYGTSKKEVVLCLNLIPCYKNLVEQAFCGDKSNPCQSLCDNKQAMTAAKIRIYWDAIGFAECREDWAEVQNLVDMWKNSCACVDC